MGVVTRLAAAGRGRRRGGRARRRARRRRLVRPARSSADGARGDGVRTSTTSCCAVVLLVVGASVAGLLDAAGSWPPRRPGSLGWLAPSFVGLRARRRRQLARSEAIAVWAEMLRDLLVSNAGLHEAIGKSARVAPGGDPRRGARPVRPGPARRPLVGAGPLRRRHGRPDRRHRRHRAADRRPAGRLRPRRAARRRRHVDARDRRHAAARSTRRAPARTAPPSSSPASSRSSSASSCSPTAATWRRSARSTGQLVLVGVCGIVAAALWGMVVLSRPARAGAPAARRTARGWRA